MFSDKSESTPSAAEALLSVREAITPLAAQAKERLAPLAADARELVSPLVHDAVAKGRPVVIGVVDKAGELVDEIKPKLTELIEHAAESPVVEGAAKRGRSAVAALRGELEVTDAAKPKRPRWKTFLKVVGVTALVGAVAVAIRNLLAPPNEEWLPQYPADWDTTPDSPEPTVVPQDKPDDSEKAAAGTATRAEPDPFRYGEGSFIGSEPPSGYDIKGNERSMKYHTPDAAGYDRTITELWFNSAEAAERAGFTRAGR